MSVNGIREPGTTSQASRLARLMRPERRWRAEVSTGARGGGILAALEAMRPFLDHVPAQAQLSVDLTGLGQENHGKAPWLRPPVRPGP